MKKKLKCRAQLIFLAVIFISCGSEKVDLLVYNAKIYTVNSQFEVLTSLAVLNGKFIDVGGDELILKYDSDNIINAQGMFIYPGFIDSHCHFFDSALSLDDLNLENSKSFDEVLERLKKYQIEKNKEFIIGRGWDQNLWSSNNEFPSKKLLDSIFPITPVVLERIDGHAYLVNQRALDMAGISFKTEIRGGVIYKENQKLTGILIDNAMALIDSIIPQLSIKEKVIVLKRAEKKVFKFGLTTVSDAGLEIEDLKLIDSLHKINELSLRVYGMINYSPKNVDYFLQNGPIKTERLTVRSFKVYLDGALGSRGAALKESYTDKREEFGNLIFSINKFEEICYRLARSGFQLNTHAIGDLSNSIVLNSYNKALRGVSDPRWRLEHAQIIDKNDLELLNRKIIPSVQPTQAISDMDWAFKRLGEKRIKVSYAYKDLLDRSGKITLGSDFPVESINPLVTFYSSVSRKSLNGLPEGGFQFKNALSRSEALKGITSWAAYSNFEELEKGTISIGKFADFVILKNDILKIQESSIPRVKVIATILNGEVVYSIPM
tara:strand:+ start:1127 stop:2770 length:1644 start_codon:yes stop_codon:yes gene_type:complete